MNKITDEASQHKHCEHGELNFPVAETALSPERLLVTAALEPGALIVHDEPEVWAWLGPGQTPQCVELLFGKPSARPVAANLLLHVGQELTLPSSCPSLAKDIFNSATKIRNFYLG
ncbi:hypothetical protein [Rhizobium leguminosarum]|uniref:hypothetical protein n=1 Tax=Rhizobium leguminosarum TaxID=384 RepID=UPI0021BC1B71|nr:hypothetical protein [Rhizobium leguminosarum]